MSKPGPDRQPTMTAGELTNLLAKYPPDMPVLAAWEGVLAPINADKFEVEPADKKITLPCLVVDVGEYDPI